VQAFAEVVKLSSTIIFYMPNTVRLAVWWAEHSGDSIRASKTPESLAEEPAFGGGIGWNLEGVSFRFTEEMPSLFNGLKLRILPRSSLVITGASGSGKSTLLALLLGNLRPSEGSVSLLAEGEERAPEGKVRRKLLASIGYVGPESFLVEGTILENVTYGINRPCSDADVKEALLQAECGFVFSLPRGLDHRITEQGTGLSAGQKQRLSLARALLRKPLALILDEATSNLDRESEARLIETLRGLKASTTLIIVTHREAILTLADQILTLDQGPSQGPY
jgi:ABC-type bacteriocin/lantibiotic exporter with double-glycine peptidase domain